MAACWTRRLVFIAALVSVARLAAPALADPLPCSTPSSPDGHEPPCNPWLAQSDWPAPHRNPYVQDSSPLPGPGPNDVVTVRHIPVEGIPVFLNFTGPYADGGHAIWATAVTTPDLQMVYKLDYPTGAILGLHANPTTAGASVSGAYALVDYQNRLIVGRGQTMNVYADVVPGVRQSPITKITQYTLPADRLCNATDRLIGIVMLWDGRVAFASAGGAVGVIPSDPSQMTDANLVTNLTACGEVVSNSIGADENGGIYTVTSAAQYKHVWNGQSLDLAWRVAVPSDGYQGGVRLGPGSGSSPTIMGTASGDDKLVVITDGRQVMHLLMMWRDDIPQGWQPIAPGADPRIACDVRIDFGDASIEKAQSEQSVVVRGYAAVVVNNSLRDSSLFDQFPSPENNAAAVLLGDGDPTNAPHGMERVDWDPASRTCKVIWANIDVSIPNAIPSLSATTNLVYAIGQRNGVWGLEGVDFANGESVLRVDSSVLPFSNSFYADTEIAPDSSIWTGTFGGVEIFRPAALP